MTKAMTSPAVLREGWCGAGGGIGKEVGLSSRAVEREGMNGGLTALGRQG